MKEIAIDQAQLAGEKGSVAIEQRIGEVAGYLKYARVVEIAGLPDSSLHPDQAEFLGLVVQPYPSSDGKVMIPYVRVAEVSRFCAPGYTNEEDSSQLQVHLNGTVHSMPRDTWSAVLAVVDIGDRFLEEVARVSRQRFHTASFLRGEGHNSYAPFPMDPKLAPITHYAAEESQTPQ